MTKKFEAPRLTQDRLNEIANIAYVYKISDHDGVAIAIRDLIREIERLKLTIKELREYDE